MASNFNWHFVMEYFSKFEAVMYTVNRKKTWQYICDHNYGKPRWILISFAYLKTGMNALCKRAPYLFISHVM